MSARLSYLLSPLLVQQASSKLLHPRISQPVISALKANSAHTLELLSHLLAQTSTTVLKRAPCLFAV